MPKQFWKILYFREAGAESVQARGYVLTQADLLTGLEALELPEFAVFEAPITRIAEMTGLDLFAGVAVETVGRRRRRGESATEAGAIRRVGSVREILG